MAKVTIAFAVLFILMGLGAYVGFESQSITSLIPTFYGLLLLVFGLIGLKESLRMHAMHGASVLALLGLGPLFMGLTALARGGELERPNATYIQVAMGSLALVLLVLYVRSFINARKARKAAEAQTANSDQAPAENA